MHRRDYPQSNGKIERWHKTLKADAIRPGQPTTLDDARALVARWVEHYNTVRLHSAIGYIAPADFLAHRGAAIWAGSAGSGSVPDVLAASWQRRAMTTCWASTSLYAAGR